MVAMFGQMMAQKVKGQQVVEDSSEIDKENADLNVDHSD
jgi:hypothetical protein